MATTRWTGATSSSWTTAGNWTNGVPGNGDIAIMASTATRGPTTNTDLSAASRHLAALYVEEGFNYTVGAASTPLICTSDLIHVVGTQNSTLYYTPSAAAGIENTDLMIVESPNVINAVTLNNGGQTVNRLDILQGKVISAETGISYINLKQTARFNNKPSLSMTASNEGLVLSQNGGVVHSSCSADVCKIWVLNGGEALVTTPPVATNVSPSIHIMSGLFRHEGGGGSVLNASTFFVHGGVLEMHRVVDAEAVAVYIWPEATVYENIDASAVYHNIGID